MMPLGTNPANDRIIKLHRTIGVMLIALVMSLCIIAAKQLGFIQDDVMTELIGRFNFGETLIQGMLGALLFGDAINLRYEDMRPRLVVISVLAVVGVIISTFIVGYLVYFAASALHIHLPLVWCLTFGAVVSPTDPIAVIAILRSIGVSKGLDMDVCGESLFNDGIGLVAFTFFFSLAMSGETMGALEVSTFFARTVFGGILLLTLLFPISINFILGFLAALLGAKETLFYIATGLNVLLILLFSIYFPAIKLVFLDYSKAGAMTSIQKISTAVCDIGGGCGVQESDCQRRG